MSENALGQMYLIYNKILVVCESNEVIFYEIGEKKSKNKFQEVQQRNWK